MKRNIGFAMIVRPARIDVLRDHVHDDVLPGNRRKDAVAHAGLVRHALDADPVKATPLNHVTGVASPLRLATTAGASSRLAPLVFSGCWLVRV